MTHAEKDVSRSSQTTRDVNNEQHKRGCRVWSGGECNCPGTRPEYECIHCGQRVSREGRDKRGSLTCDEFAADADMQDEEHDFDLGCPIPPGKGAGRCC